MAGIQQCSVRFSTHSLHLKIEMENDRISSFLDMRNILMEHGNIITGRHGAVLSTSTAINISAADEYPLVRNTNNIFIAGKL